MKSQHAEEMANAERVAQSLTQQVDFLRKTQADKDAAHAREVKNLKAAVDEIQASSMNLNADKCVVAVVLLSR